MGCPCFTLLSYVFQHTGSQIKRAYTGSTKVSRYMVKLYLLTNGFKLSDKSEVHTHLYIGNWQDSYYFYGYLLYKIS